MEVNLPCKCSGLWFLTKASLNFNTDRSAYTLKFVKIFNSSKLKTLVLSADTSFVGRGYLTGRVRPKKLLIHLMYLFFPKILPGVRLSYKHAASLGPLGDSPSLLAYPLPWQMPLSCFSWEGGIVGLRETATVHNASYAGGQESC